MTIGLKGHVLGPAFPEGYSNWQKTDLHDLIDAELIKEPTDKNVVKAIKKVAKEADELVIATDFDREGELIGLEALEEMLDANPELGSREGTADGSLVIQRARYSALTKEEIERAFANLDTLSYPLANAGAARQDIDLLWGATLTRAVSLASRRFGSNFLSVGRVQSPTLGLIVEREMERRAHVAKPFWELFAKFEHPDGTFETHHSVDKFWEQSRGRRGASPGPWRRASSKRSRRAKTPASRRRPTTPPPSAPTPPAASASPPPARCGSPRTSTWTASSPTRAPTTRSTRPRCRCASWSPRWSRSKSSPPPSGLLDRPQLTPTRGKKETTDHPPIYPTQAIHPGALDGPKKRVYELVVRRFLATFSPPMITESTRADIEAGSETYFVRGSVVVDPGYAGIYTYARSADEEIPALQRGPGAGARRRRPGSSTRRPSRPARISQAQTDRADGGARPRHQGHPRRHHPEALRPRLRLRQPADSRGDRDRPLRGLQELRAGDGDAGDDRPARGGDGPDRRRRDDQGRRRRREPRPPAQDLDRDRRQPRGPGQSRSGKGWTKTASSAPARSARKPAARRRTARRTCCGSSARKNRANASSAAAAGPSTTPTPATRPSRCPSAATSSSSKTAARSASRRRG